MLIISGAPLIDRVRSSGSFASSLTGVTIAVVGVIAALAVYVARNALRPGGDTDWFLVAVAVVAFVAVWRFRAGVVTVVAACAVAGLIAQLV